jgi:hypothetical protein
LSSEWYTVIESVLLGLVSLLLFVIKRHARTETDRHTEFAKTSEARHQENVDSLHRIENGLVGRLQRLEDKVDRHLSWHLNGNDK